jgi:hypothetical protein
MSTQASSSRRRLPIVRLIIYAGAAGTLVLVVAGCLRAIGRIAERNAQAELLVVIPLWLLVATWTLSPYWGALRLHRRGMPSRAMAVIVGLAGVLVVGLGANSFLVTAAFVGGQAHPTADGVTIVVVPILQWIVLGAAILISNLVVHRSTRGSAQAG